MNRRTFCTVTASSMAALASGVTYGAPDDAKPFRSKFAPHLGLLPTAPKGFLEQLQFAHDLGFRAWEENWLSGKKPELQEQVGAFIKENGMELGVTVITGGQGVKFYAPTDEGVEKVLKDMRSGVELAKRTGQTNMTMIPGPRDDSQPREKQLEQSVGLMRRCCDVVEEHGIILALEPLSHGVGGGPPLIRSFEDGHLLCKLVDRKSCKLLADFFHEGQIGNGDKLIENAEKVWDQVSYVQYGASPGRKEPGTGKLDYVAVTQWLRRKGYTGIIGMEHGTSKQGQEGLDALLAAYRKIDA
jgi:hydroxypyruvate isomerase